MSQKVYHTSRTEDEQHLTLTKNPSVLLCRPGDAKIEDRPIPTIEDPNDVIIRIEYVGVCGSDVSLPW